MKSQHKAYLFAFLAIACWSTIGSAFKITLRYLNPLSLLLISSLVACLILMMILVVQGKTSQLKKISATQFLTSGFLGFLNPFLYYLVLLKAYFLLPAQEAGTLNYIWPIFLVLLSIPLLKQKISIWSISAILLSFTGILMISTHGQLFGMRFTNGAGVILATGSAVIWALYWILNLKDQREAVSKLFLNFCFGFIYTLILFGFSGSFCDFTREGIAGGIYIGIFEMGLTFVLWLNALKLSATTAKVSNLIYFSPFLSLIIIHYTVGEVILVSTIIGLILIVSGIILQQYLKR